MVPVAVYGDLALHVPVPVVPMGALIATGAKLMVSGKIVGVSGDLHMPHLLPKPIHPSIPFGTVLSYPIHKLMVSGRYVAASGDILSCTAFLIGTGAKLVVN
jgi:hypothetical protein